ncbi:MAG: phenylacetate--CoA ligase family protein [Anaplasmataceae bacterium]|nr:phenylacetate--CoA ligase family protein [Anaplasmataceae bacterium]
MANRVPAYKDFLKKHKLNPEKIKNIKDFSNVPLLDKDNYLRKYPIEKLCWDGEYQRKSWEIAATSGSTGVPFYFPREDSQNYQYAATAELYLLNNFDIDKKTTLYVNCFALGVWIGGLYTYEAVRILSSRGHYPITLINPGLNKVEILKSVKNLGYLYDQVIIGGYPPFVKDVIDEGLEAGIKWSNYNLGIIFSAEGFSEEFRKHISKKAGIKNSVLRTLNHYGTVDQGTIAHETPLSILLRKISLQKPAFFNSIFTDDISHLPTLAQYDPELFYFEEFHGGVVCSSYSGLPLVRYDLKDHGGVLTYEEMVNRCNSNGINIDKEISRAKIDGRTWKLPFVYVYERKDMSVTLSGANVYPENVKRALQNRSLSQFYSGKFTMLVHNDAKQDQYLEINIEMKHGLPRPNKSLIKMTEKIITGTLLKENSEFRIIYQEKKKKVSPRLKFWTYGNGKYFSGGGKQKWSVKSTDKK